MMSQALTGDVIRDQMIPLAATLAADPIPNIRFNVAKAIGFMVPLLKKSNLQVVLEDSVRPTLTKMLEDTDVDVRFYAQQSLASI